MPKTFRKRDKRRKKNRERIATGAVDDEMTVVSDELFDGADLPDRGRGRPSKKKDARPAENIKIKASTTVGRRPGRPRKELIRSYFCTFASFFVILNIFALLFTAMLQQ